MIENIRHEIDVDNGNVHNTFKWAVAKMGKT